MKIKKGDKVKILAGKDKDKTGKVLQVFADRNSASIEGLNLLIKHLRPRKQGEKGQRIEFPAPINLSNLALDCPNCGRPTRVSYQSKEIQAGEGMAKKVKKYRVCKKCKQVID
ncbi:MAG: 50S ribosomal protein L24 [Candidatus Falkowbacteria bacterium]|nr:50S ribosomal protein L24 [Candidatus Falkowbacteria bacterium]